MKKLILIMLILLSNLTLNAAQSKSHNPKQYIQGDELFLYNHGIYLAYPGKLYRIQAMYFSKTKGYYTYGSKMKRIPLENMRYHDWSNDSRVHMCIKKN